MQLFVVDYAVAVSFMDTGVVMSEAQEKTNNIRRKLLKAMVYTPPVILGSMVVTPRSAMGAIGSTATCPTAGGSAFITIVISSGANACCPCVPGSTQYNAATCSDQQCINSCGANCTPAQLAATSCSTFCQTCGFTPAGCNNPCKKPCAPNPKKPGTFKC